MKRNAKLEYKKKYAYYDQLTFLIPHVKGNTRTSTNIPAEDVPEEGLDETHGEQSAVVDGIVNIPVVRQQSASDTAERQKRQTKAKSNRNDIAKTITSTSKSLTDILTQSIQMRKDEMTSDKYGNKAFLFSFVPLMDNLPPNVAIYARMKISELFHKLAYEGLASPPLNLPGPSSSSSSTNPSLTTSHSPSSISSPQTPQQEFNVEDSEFNLSSYLQL